MIEDADIFQRAVSMILNGLDVEALAQLKTFSSNDPLSKPQYEKIPGVGSAAEKQPLDTKLRVAIYGRDGWRCRYCRRKLVVPGVLALLTIACPGFRGLMRGHRMPTATTERAVVRVYPNVDHIVPVSKGGAWRDPDNHVTACTPCNELKGDHFGWKPLAIEVNDWDGLTHMYRPLATKAGFVTSYHLRWMKALNV